MRRVRVVPELFPPEEQTHVIALACQAPVEAQCTSTRWSLDDIAATIVNDAYYQAISRSTIWRILNETDLKPHRSVYWLNSPDPDFDRKARTVCQLYIQAPHLYEQGHLILCSDEKTGMQILQRKYPTRLVQPGKPEKREHEYVRHGTRALIASFAVSTGEVVWDLGTTRTSDDFADHLLHTVDHFRQWSQITWVMDNLNTHWSLQSCELLAALNDRPFDKRVLSTGAQRRAFLTNPEHAYRFVFTPKHGSWLNQVELWFSVLARRFLQRGNFCSPADFATRLRKFIENYNAHHAHAYRWTYTGQPLVRATPFSQTRRQQRHGRAWFSPRPRCFERILYPPRPYHRKHTTLAKDL